MVPASSLGPDGGSSSATPGCQPALKLESKGHMSLAPGTQLSPFEILAPIGAGGMGEVYRARDSKLDRAARSHLVGWRSGEVRAAARWVERLPDMAT